MYKFIGLIALALASVSYAQKIPVQVYYEALCPDSQAFITQQIYPEMKNGLNDHVEIDWIPFGKAKYHTQGQGVIFECHHGPAECYGNKVHACAIRHIEVNSYQKDHTRETLILEYINCLMRAGKNFPDSIYPGERCARETNVVNWQNIVQCANSTEGESILREYGDRTVKFQDPLKSVPSVTFNQQRDEDIQAKALFNFRNVVCKMIRGPQPRICSSENGSGNLTPAAAITTLVLAFFVQRFY